MKISTSEGSLGFKSGSATRQPSQPALGFKLHTSCLRNACRCDACMHAELAQQEKSRFSRCRELHRCGEDNSEPDSALRTELSEQPLQLDLCVPVAGLRTQNLQRIHIFRLSKLAAPFRDHSALDPHLAPLLRS